MTNGFKASNEVRFTISPSAKADASLTSDPPNINPCKKIDKIGARPYGLVYHTIITFVRLYPGSNSVASKTWEASSKAF